MRVELKLNVLKQWLAQESKTNTDFAALSGIHPVRVSQILNGKVRPSIRNRAGIIKATGLTFSQLFDFIEETE